MKKRSLSHLGAYPGGKLPPLDFKQPTDLTYLCRDKDTCDCTVYLLDGAYDDGGKSQWLKLGSVDLRQKRESRSDGRWELTARMDGVDDFEHSACYVIALPLIGVGLDGSMPVMNHVVTLKGWVSPEENQEDGWSSFHVPRAGYDPRKHPGTITCKDCSFTDRHVIVPDGASLYQPQFDAEMYEAVRGKRVEVRIAPKRSTR